MFWIANVVALSGLGLVAGERRRRQVSLHPLDRRLFTLVAVAFTVLLADLWTLEWAGLVSSREARASLVAVAVVFAVQALVAPVLRRASMRMLAGRFRVVWLCASLSLGLAAAGSLPTTIPADLRLDLAWAAGVLMAMAAIGALATRVLAGSRSESRP